MPDLIRHPVFLFLDSCFRRNDEAEASFGECTQRDSSEPGWITASGKGNIFTFAVYRQAFHPAFRNDVPYVVALVKLEEGPLLLSNIVGCEPDEVACGMYVEVTWEKVTEQFTLPKFRKMS